MEFNDLHLDAISFTAAPTKTQIVNTIRDMQKFLTRLGGALLVDGSYALGDEPIAILFNGTIQLRGAADRFEAGPNVAGLTTPQPVPGQVGPRRV